MKTKEIVIINSVLSVESWFRNSQNMQWFISYGRFKPQEVLKTSSSSLIIIAHHVRLMTVCVVLHCCREHMLHKSCLAFVWLFPWISDHIQYVCFLWHLRTCFMVRPQHTGLDLLQEAAVSPTLTSGGCMDGCTECSWSDNMSAAAFYL